MHEFFAFVMVIMYTNQMMHTKQRYHLSYVTNINMVA